MKRFGPSRTFISLLALFLVIVANYFGTKQLQEKFVAVDDSHVPAIVTAEEARNAMLEMLVNLRTYQASGDAGATTEFENERETFELGLRDLRRLADQSPFQSPERLDEINAQYENWIEAALEIISYQDDVTENAEVRQIFAEEIDPISDEILAQLTTLIAGQQAALEDDLATGQTALRQSITLTLLIGGIASVLLLAFWLFRAGRGEFAELELMRSIIDSIPDLVYAKDTQGRFLIANRALADSMGVQSPVDLLGKSDFDFHARELAEQFYADEQSLLHSGQALVNHSERVFDGKGNEQWLLTTKVPVRDNSGRVIGLVGINRDVTDMRNAEASAAMESRLLRNIIDNSPDFIYVKDTESRFLLANKALANLMGLPSPDALIGKSEFDFYSHQLASRYRADDLRILETGNGVIARAEPLVNRTDTETGWLLTTKLPLRDDEDKIIGLMGIGRNITALKNVEIQTKQTAANIADAAAHIQSATNQQASSVNQQDEAVASTVVTVEQLRQAVSQTAQHAQQVASIAQMSVEVSREGEMAVNNTINSMQQIHRKVEHIAENILALSEHTQQIGDIVDSVSTLATQSKILAFNASIEAARAGEEGKGFAVVAVEVRKMAEMSREATARVQELLTEIQHATNTAVMVTEEGTKQVASGVTLVNRAGESIRELSNQIQDAAQSATEIATSTQQQAAGMDQLSDIMSQIREANAQLMASIRQTENNLNNLLELAQETESIGQETVS